MCCAAPGWPSKGGCVCESFVCYATQDSFDTVLCGFAASTTPVGSAPPTTSATGSCCVYNDTKGSDDPHTWDVCECSERCTQLLDEGAAAFVISCTIHELTPCEDSASAGYTQVDSCGGQ